MKRSVLVACACLMTAPILAQTADADKNLLKETARKMVEERTREDFEQLKNKQRDKDAIDAIKVLFYNKAYIYYACLVSIGREKFSDKAVAECVQEPMTEFIAGLSKAKEYLSNPKAAACETKARLVKEEADFPPYGFLAGDDVHLLDFKTIRTCLTSR